MAETAVVKELAAMRAEPPVLDPESRRQRVDGLEAIRAIAALSVVVEHSFSTGPVIPGFVPPDWLFQTFFSHASVLLFFLLSGYVIGLTTAFPFSAKAARFYLLKRLARLYPVFLVGLLLGWWVGVGPRSVAEAVGNLLLIGSTEPYFGFGIYPPLANAALWTIAYEAVYYVSFLAIWAYRPRWSMLFLASLIIGALGMPGIGMPVFLSGWATGFLFWGGGLWLAWNAERGGALRRPILAWFFLLICVSHMNPFMYLGIALFNNKSNWPRVCITDLAFLPVCILIVCDAAGIILARRRQWIAASFALPAIGLAMFAAIRVSDISKARFLVPLVAFVAAAALQSVRGDISRARWLVWLGGCSYGIYALHLPITWIFREHFPWDRSPVITASGVVLFFLIVVGVSYAVESAAKKLFLDPLRGRK
ncbi:hypothetical protein BH09SUM1_BH09SUM1_32130 [soil metagenome]